MPVLGCLCQVKMASVNNYRQNCLNLVAMVFEICIEVFNLPKANSHFCKNLRSPEATGNNNNNNSNNNNWVKCLKNSGLTKTLGTS